MTDGNSVTVDGLSFLDVVVGAGADDEREDLLIAANKPFLEDVCCDACKPSCCR
jgi:hypothetical protein